MKFVKESTPRGLLLPPAAMRLAGLNAGDKVEYHAWKGTLVVLKGQMTALELLTAARSLHDLSVELNTHLSKVCGQCDGCGAGAENGGDGCPLTDSPPQSPLCSVSTCGENYARSLAPPLRGRPAALGSAAITGNGRHNHDLRDIPQDTLEMFRAANVCLGELRERLIAEDTVYGS